MKTGPQRAYTLLEVTIAAALVGALAGVLGLSLREGGSTQGLRTALDQVSAALHRARVQAALSGTRSRLLIYSDSPENPDVSRRLRFLQVVVEKADGRWSRAGEGIFLHGNARVVPTTAPETLSAAGWGGAPLSSLAGDAVMDVTIGTRVETARFFYVEFTPLGNTTLATVALAPARERAAADGGGIAFAEPADVRGIKVSQYGAQTMLSDVTAF